MILVSTVSQARLIHALLESSVMYWTVAGSLQSGVSLVLVPACDWDSQAL